MYFPGNRAKSSVPYVEEASLALSTTFFMEEIALTISLAWHLLKEALATLYLLHQLLNSLELPLMDAISTDLTLILRLLALPIREYVI